MMDPLQIMENYEVSVVGEFIKDLNLSSIDKGVVLCIVNIANECASVTSNLVGPVILNPEKMLARHGSAAQFSIRFKTQYFRKYSGCWSGWLKIKFLYISGFGRTF
jgi:flagellar assembly factor FliW